MIDRWLRRLGGRLGAGARRAPVLALGFAQIASLTIPDAGVSAADSVLALEIDATALLALEQKTAVIATVKSDRPVRPQ